MSDDNEEVFDDDFKDEFVEKFNDLVDVAQDLESMMEEEKDGATIQNVPNFVLLMRYAEETDLVLPDKITDDQEEYIVGKGVHGPTDILDFTTFLIQTLARPSALGPEKTARWLREIRVGLDDEESQESE
jgi:hypothetical protein